MNGIETVAKFTGSSDKSDKKEFRKIDSNLNGSKNGGWAFNHGNWFLHSEIFD